MNRRERRAYKHLQHSFAAALPENLTLIPPGETPQLAHLMRAWRSRKYCAQLYDEGHIQPGLLRLSICRARLGDDGRWLDGLTWDELQAIKREVGYGDSYAVEVYPREHDLINVANFRHLWLLPVPLAIGWFST